MGWYGTYGATRADIIKQIIKESTWEREGVTHRVLANCLRGSTLWALHETKHADGTEVRFISAYLLYSGKGEAGYKPVSEDMGPCEVSCPLGYLDKTTEPINEWSREWRERVRAFHKRTGQKLTVGQVVKLQNATVPEVRITSVKPLRGEHNGFVYRLSRRLLAVPA